MYVMFRFATLFFFPLPPPDDNIALYFTNDLFVQRLCRRYRLMLWEKTFAISLHLIGSCLYLEEIMIAAWNSDGYLIAVKYREYIKDDDLNLHMTQIGYTDNNRL